MRKPRGPRPSFSAICVLAGVVGCGPMAQPAEPSAEATDEGTSAPSSSSSGIGGSSTVAQEEPDTSSDDGGGTPPSNFLEEPDGGGSSFECDTWTQNCPLGEKCAFWANDGGGSWNATRCVPIAPEPDEIGEPCTVEGNGVTGIDSCVFGAMCWDVDPETNEGTCAGMCEGGESHPICADPTMRCVGRGPYLCLPTCCPVEQDCVEGQGCYPVNDDFMCAPDASGAMGGYGDPCEFINVCDPGLACLAADVTPDCADGSVGCCTAFCELGSASCSLLNPDLECVPWYDAGEAPPAFEHTGVCAMP